MKRFFKVFIPIVLVLAIIACMGWYLLIYDRDFTRDMLLNGARYLERNGSHTAAAWLYDVAYSHSGDDEAVAIELALQYKASGNYTKTEFVLSNAIADGGGASLYVELSKTYIEQDKVLDAVKMLDNVANPQIKAELEAMRPDAPIAIPDPGFYSQYIGVEISGGDGTLYVTTDKRFPSTTYPSYTDPITLVEGENTIYAVEISQNGLVSPLATFGYTVGGVIQPVTFADSAMETHIRTVLGLKPEDAIYTNQLWNLESLEIPSEAKDYSDLKYFTYLQSLTIENGASDQLENISRLANLSALHIRDTAVSEENMATIATLPLLRELTLSGCGLSSIDPLEMATGLTYIDLSRNSLRHINAMSNMTGLIEVYLQENTISNLRALTNAKKLQKLNISYNNVSTLTMLENHSDMTHLLVSNNKVTALTGLEKLAKLYELDLSFNQVSDITLLNACTQLTKLNVSNNLLTDITALVGCIRLMELNFSNNQVTVIPDFSKDMPLVTIDGSYNLIVLLDPLSGMPMLNNVFMDYNPDIASVEPLASCPTLIKVNVFGTKVEDVGSLTAQSIIVKYDPTINKEDKD